MQTASTVDFPRGQGASAAVPSGRAGHRAPTGKRSTPTGQGSAARAAAPETRKRAKIPEVTLREGLFFGPSRALGVACTL